MKLSKALILETALQQIEKQGLNEFSMRSLAGELKVRPMSLYHYFPNRLDLLNTLLDQVLLKAQFLPAEHGWQERLKFTAHEWRCLAHLYPNFFQFFSIHRLDTEGALRFLHSVLEIFFATGLDDEQCAKYFKVMSNYLMGAAMDETAGSITAPSATRQVTSAQARLLFPKVLRIGHFLSVMHQDKCFECGVDMIIESIERSIEKSNETSASNSHEKKADALIAPSPEEEQSQNQV